MSYSYATQRPVVFTEAGQVMFLRIYDSARDLIKTAGAVRADKLIMAAGTCDTWDVLACIDRLVELGEIVEVKNTVSEAGQFRLFTKRNDVL